MWNSTEPSASPGQPTGLLGDIRALAGQLDLPPRPWTDIRTRAGRPAGGLTREDLRDRLEQYTEETLCAAEWPLIQQAHRLACEGKVRELIALDRGWSPRAREGPFAEASFRAGRRQLNRLQGLKHERLLQRYRAAIEAGEAWGWHPIVFGVVLAVYQLPLRQGLIQFASHSLAGIASAAEGFRGLPPAQCQEVLDATLASLPDRLARIPLGGPTLLA